MEQFAIIGAGVSGLVSLKTALEHKYNVKVFEREPSLGGLWNYRSPSEVCPGFVDIETSDKFVYPLYKSVTTNHAAYNSYFSDFQLEQCRGYLTHGQVMDYLRAYADHFNLHPYIEYNCKVIRLCKDGSQWNITYEKNGKKLTETFQKVLIATGMFRYPRIPVFQNSDLFQGLFIHSCQVRDEDALFSGKRVLIIGGSHTGGELAYFASKANARHVFIIQSSDPGTRKAWLWNRFVESSNGTKEWDYKRTYENSVDSSGFGDVLKDIVATIDGEKPEKIPDLYDDVPCCVHSKEYLRDKIDSGKLTVVKSPVIAFSNNSVTLSDGSVLPNLDIIVAATGFINKFPFLENILDHEKPRKFYHSILPTDKNLDGLAFVMMIKTGPNVPIAELQARWLCHKFLPKHYINNTGLLYTDDERQQMEEGITKLTADIGKVRLNEIRNIYVYMNDLAAEINVLPPDHNLLLTSKTVSNVELGVALFHGPITSLRFRIARERSTPELENKLVNFVKEVMGTSKFQSYVDKYMNKVVRK